MISVREKLASIVNSKLHVFDYLYELDTDNEEVMPPSIYELRSYVTAANSTKFISFAPFKVIDAATGKLIGEFKSFKDFLDSQLAVDLTSLGLNAHAFLYGGFQKYSTNGVTLAVSTTGTHLAESTTESESRSNSLADITDNVTKYLDEIYINIQDKNIPEEAYDSCVRLYEEAKHILKVVGFDITFDESTAKHTVMPGNKSLADGG